MGAAYAQIELGNSSHVEKRYLKFGTKRETLFYGIINNFIVSHISSYIEMWYGIYFFKFSEISNWKNPTISLKAI